MNKDKAIQLLERLQDPEPYEPMLTKDAYDAIQMAIDALSADGDTISRKAAVERATKEHDFFRGAVTVSDKARRDELLNVMCWLGELPSAQPEITDEQAIEHLQSTGWMQNHDREMYESGLREQLADDSGAYDSLFSCEDAISRQAAINCVMECYDNDELFEVYEDRLNELPPAQPEQLGTNLAEVGTDCISRQDALEAFGLSEKTRKYGGDHSGYDTMMMYEIQDTIENLPPIQPDIVRCKDCKYWMPYDWMFSEVWRSKNMADYPEDEIGCNWCDMTMKANDFCSRGERKTT